jgi:hypothetical protein
MAQVLNVFSALDSERSRAEMRSREVHRVFNKFPTAEIKQKQLNSQLGSHILTPLAHKRLVSNYSISR